MLVVQKAVSQPPHAPLKLYPLITRRDRMRQFWRGAGVLISLPWPDPNLQQYFLVCLDLMRQRCYYMPVRLDDVSLPGTEYSMDMDMELAVV